MTASDVTAASLDTAHGAGSCLVCGGALGPSRLAGLLSCGTCRFVTADVRLSPGDPGLHRQAAELYEALKRPREALREVELSLSGQTPDAATRAWMERLRTAIDLETVRALDPARGLDALDSADAGVDPSQPRRLRGR